MTNELWVVHIEDALTPKKYSTGNTGRAFVTPGPAKGHATRVNNYRKRLCEREGKPYTPIATVVRYVPAEVVCPHCKGTGTYWNGQSEGLTGKASEMMDCPACSDPR